MNNKKNNQPLISIIVPVYNVERFLDKCINSIISQTYDKLEIILVDDGSVDKSPIICDEWAKKDKRIIVIHKKNGGVSSARNIGLNIAKGDYVQFVDSDDYVSANYSKKLLNSMIINKSDFVCSGMNWFKEKIKGGFFVDENLIITNPTQNLQMIYDIQQKLILNSAWSKIYKKAIIKDQRFNENNCYGEDLMFVFDYLIKCRSVVIIKESGYFYNKNNENSITNSWTLKKAKMNAFSYNYIANIYKKYGMKKLCKLSNTEAISSFISYLIETAKTDKQKFYNDVKEVRNNNLFIETYKNNSLKLKFKIFVKLIKMKFYKMLFFIIRKVAK